MGLKLHEGGLEFEVRREGNVLTPEIPVSGLQKYVGRYGAAGATDFAILNRNQRPPIICAQAPSRPEGRAYARAERSAAPCTVPSTDAASLS